MALMHEYILKMSKFHQQALFVSKLLHFLGIHLICKISELLQFQNGGEIYSSVMNMHKGY